LEGAIKPFQTELTQLHRFIAQKSIANRTDAAMQEAKGCGTPGHDRLKDYVSSDTPLFFVPSYLSHVSQQFFIAGETQEAGRFTWPPG